MIFRAKKFIKKLLISDMVGAFLFLECLFLPRLPIVGKLAQAEDLLLASFVTYFDQNNQERAKNIQLACRFLNGCKVESGQTFSFNQRVGLRTEERGFLYAPVILEGQYVLGVGGGVCQVSTTLYNAVLATGLHVQEVHAHSLRVGYVAPSLDAMVSAYSDLRFVNSKSAPIVIYATGEEGILQVKIYGKKDGMTYQTKSVILNEVEPIEQDITKGENEIKGVHSEAYLTVLRRGKILSNRRIRKDFYPLRKDVEQKQETPTEEKEQKN